MLDTTAPAAPSITSVTDDALLVTGTGTLISGGSTNDTDLTVRVGLSGINAFAGDTIQLYNGTGTSSQVGTSYTITSGDISNGFADVQTGALSNGTTYTITARITDQAGNQSNASGSFVVTEDSAPVTTPVTLAAIAEDSGARLITQAELLANASDVDGPSLTAVNLAIASGLGTLVNNGNGTWSYTPAANDDTAVTFSYAVTDGVARTGGDHRQPRHHTGERCAGDDAGDAGGGHRGQRGAADHAGGAAWPMPRTWTDRR